MRDMNALNVYQINMLQILQFMYKAKHNLNPIVFDNAFTEIHHRHPRRFSRSNFKDPKKITKATSFAISSRDQRLGRITYMNLKKRFNLCLYFEIN